MTGQNGQITGKTDFRATYERVLPVLKARLPDSCYTYNQVMLHKDTAIEKDLEIFAIEDKSINSSGNGNLWIILNFYRGDWKQCVTISPPSEITHGTMPISPAMQDIIETSGMVDWLQPFVCIVDQSVSTYLFKLNTCKLPNTVKVFPSHLFYMDPEAALKLELPVLDASMELRPIDVEEGADFFAARWAYTKDGSIEHFRKCIRTGFSVGLYVKDELVCAALIPGLDGLVNCLVTHPSHRRKGYASVVMKYSYREMARHGFHPCLDAEAADMTAVGFHKSVNPRIISTAHYFCHKALI